MNPAILSERTIRTGARYPDKETAIRACGEILRQAGHIEAAYIDCMVERDRASTVYVGNGVAVPHGTKASQSFIRSTGMALVQCPDGVDFDGERARLLVAIAARGDEHMDLLNHIALVCSDEERLECILAAGSPADLLRLVAEAEVDA